MKDARFVIQIINAESGNRSKPFQATWDDLATSLTKAGSAVNSKDYILLVAAVGKDESNEQQLQIPQSPLITIETFLDMFENKPAEAKA